MQVAIRRPDPLVARLAHVMGRSVGTDELSVRLPDQAALAPTPGSMTLLVRLQTRGNALLPEEAPAPQDFPEPRPVDTLQNRLEILDARQRPLAFRVVSAEVDDSGESLVVIRLSGRDASEKPDALRIFSLIMGAVEVPFRFSQLPIP